MKYLIDRGGFFSSKTTTPTSDEQVAVITRGLMGFLINYYKCVTNPINHIFIDKSVCDYLGVKNA